MNLPTFLVLLAAAQPQPVPLPICRPVRVPKSRMISHVQCMDYQNGIYFRIPSSWKASPTLGGGQDVWYLSFTASDTAERTGLTLKRGGFDQAAADLGFFRDDSGWHIQGLGVFPAQFLDAASWRGLRGEVQTKSGDPANVSGIIEVLRAFATSTDGNLTLEVEPSGPESLDFILEHLTFLPARAP